MPSPGKLGGENGQPQRYYHKSRAGQKNERDANQQDQPTNRADDRPPDSSRQFIKM